jgi:hypothetical protein
MKSRLETIREISLKTGKTFDEVQTVYTKVNSEVYFDNYKQGYRFQIYHPVLEEKVAKKTLEECMNGT